MWTVIGYIFSYIFAGALVVAIGTAGLHLAGEDLNNDDLELIGPTCVAVLLWPIVLCILIIAGTAFVALYSGKIAARWLKDASK